MNIYIKKLLIVSYFILLTLISIPTSVFATSFDLLAPEPPLERGQNVQFTINIDTEGQSLSSTSIGMTYDAQVLEYISVSPGDTFTTISADVQGGGKLIINGSGEAYSGTGTYAYVTFKIVAAQSGSSQLCVLFNPVTPTSTPVPGPTSTPIPTVTPGGPTVTPGPNVPVPTSLPTTGEAGPITTGIFLASFFFVLAIGGFLIFKKI